jgi:hypothetical protein
LFFNSKRLKEKYDSTLLNLKHENSFVITTLNSDTNIVLCNSINQNTELGMPIFQVSNSACSLDKIDNLNIRNDTNDGKFKHGDEFDSLILNQTQACKNKNLKGTKMFLIYVKI